MTENIKKGKDVARNAMAVTALLAAVKGIVGYAAGSLALIADALHSATDVASTAAVWLGLHISMRAPDDRFRYGYYKAETLATLVVAVLILAAGVDILVESLGSLAEPGALRLGGLALATSLGSAGVSYGLMRYKRRTGEEINSPALIADAEHSYIDVATSLVVFAGIGAAAVGYPVLEAVAGLAVSALVLRVAFKMGRESILVLMDACLCPDVVKKVSDLVAGIEGVSDVRDVRLRRAGPFLFGEATVEMAGQLSVERSHEKTEDIEAAIKKNVPDVDSFTVHVEPARIQRQTIAIPVDDDQGLAARMSEQFSKAPYFLFTVVDGSATIHSTVKRNPAAGLEKKAGMTAARFLIDEGTTALVSRNVGDGAYYALKGNQVPSYLFSGDTAGEALQAFSAGTLRKKQEGPA